jgi:hypothetical protein
VVEEEKDDTKLGTLLLKTMSKPIPSKLKAEASFGSSSSTSPSYPCCPSTLVVLAYP